MTKRMELEPDALKRYSECYIVEARSANFLYAAHDCVDAKEKAKYNLALHDKDIKGKIRYVDPNRKEDREEAMDVPYRIDAVKMRCKDRGGDWIVTVNAVCREDALIQAAERLGKEFSDVRLAAVTVVG